VFACSLAAACRAWPKARPHLLLARARPAATDPALRQTLDRYCATCHNERVKSAATAGGVVLSNADLTAAAHDPALWEKVIKRVRTGAMPPAGMPRPDAPAQAALLTYLESTLDRAAVTDPNPGRVAPHRLNRTEYANAVRDLLALSVDTSTLLPPDDSADGFDNNAGALGASPALLERYLSAAAKISALAVGSPAIAADSETYRVRGDASQTDQNDDLPPGTPRRPAGAAHVPARRRVHDQGQAAADQPRLDPRHRGHASTRDHRRRRAGAARAGRRRAGIRDGGEERHRHRQPARGAAADAGLRAGRQRPVGVAFLARGDALGGGSRLQSFRRSTLIATDHRGVPHVESFTITGPFNPKGPGDTASRRQLFTCTPVKGASVAEARTCARSIVSTLARRAYRRPVTEAELTPLLRFYDAGQKEAGFERGVEMALRAILVSPRFLMRVERDRAAVLTAQRHLPAAALPAGRGT
jgi:hypothetical protein